MKVSYYLLYALSLAGALVSCQDEDTLGGSAKNGSGYPISLSGEIDQVMTSRVNDSGFCDGDMMGVYIVDYSGETAGTLKSSGNRGDNMRFTFDETNFKWNSDYEVYFRDGVTPVDIYGYYPYSSPDDVDAYAFTVQTDQAKAAQGGTLGGYEASDFLWGKAEKIAPTEQVIRLPLKHRMANARVTLRMGEGFSETDWAGFTKNVLVLNTKVKSNICLSAGTVEATGEASTTGIIASRNGDEFRAIVVPQTIAAAVPLFSITVNGINYTFSKDAAFEYVAGKMHNFTIQVDKKEVTGDYEFTVVSESITAWENDNVSHDATAREYIVIESEAGKLKEAIKAAGKNYTQLKNLKVTGEIDGADFFFMRDSMTNLRALNLKEVKIKQNYNYNEDEIPSAAFNLKKDLAYFVFPDKLKSIGESAFWGVGLVGSLIIPEGVTTIKNDAFRGCNNLTGTLSLPSTLRSIGDGAFDMCSFVGELKLPEDLESIGNYAFSNCESLYGELKLPHNLKAIGHHAFRYCRGLSGDLEIPQSLTKIPEYVFANCGFNGHLKLYDGIVSIGGYAFFDCYFKGELVLPKKLERIESSAFADNNFSGELKLPTSLISIESGAFSRCTRLTGTLEIPENIQGISSGAFAQCSSLEKIILPKNLESIGSTTFYGCYYIGSIICQGEIPPTVLSGAFDGVPKDNFTVEVPESAVSTYQTTAGWRDFKRIAAHHELVCRPSAVCALQTKHTQTLVLNAEGAWSVESKPDWCELSATSGNKKTELTLTIDEMAAGNDSLVGEIIFKLDDKDYTTRCAVKQYRYQYAEDEAVTLQQATKGNNGGINIVILGDGYDAKDISEGTYLTDMKEEIEYFFDIEPYKTYRDYFNVYTGIALSTESGIGTVNTIRYNKFETTFTSGAGLKGDTDALFEYACKMPSVSKSNLNQTLIIVVPNTTEYGGITEMWSDGSAIAFCPKSTDDYPYDSRGLIQHEAGGHGFGKLGDEYIYHNAFIDACTCLCCEHVGAINSAKSNGWYDNLSLTGKMDKVPWSHLIFDSRYSNVVDIFEGGYMHSRGVYRSEQNSCMNNNIPYYSTISRESIVKRIMKYAGEEYTFEKFAANDVKTASTSRSRAYTPSAPWSRTNSSHQHAPIIHQGKPGFLRK